MGIYLDNNASTALDLRVLSAMEKLWGLGALNPGSTHSSGQRAKELMQSAEARVLNALGLAGHRVVFLSSATEALNLVVKGFLQAGSGLVYYSSIEHPALKGPCDETLRGRKISVDRHGTFDLASLIGGLIRGDLCAMMVANNETGGVLPWQKACEISRSNGSITLLDATQAPGKLPGFFADVANLQPDMIALSGHKIHAPVGIGALVIRRGIQLVPQITGGGQQYGLRAGTEPVVMANAFALALELARDESDPAAMAAQVERLWQAVLNAIPNAHRTLQPEESLANTLHYRVPGLSAERQVIALDMAGLRSSSSSACASGSMQPSSTLLGMGYTEEEAREGVRLCVSRLTTDSEVERACQILSDVLPRLVATP